MRVDVLVIAVDVLVIAVAVNACGCARNRRQETNVLIVSVLFAVVVNLALRSKAQGRIEVVGMCKLTIMVGLGAFPVTIMGDPEIEDEPQPRLGGS